MAETLNQSPTILIFDTFFAMVVVMYKWS